MLPEPSPYRARAGHAQRRVSDLLRLIGDPHRGLACIHIAGSKGKGSTALFAESILDAAGIKTGTFTSPHLEHWTERFRIAGLPVSSDELSATVELIRPHVNALRAQYPDQPPTFFDALTATAFYLFAQHNVEAGIIETGIGGRLDATLVAQATVTCITNVELEHTDKLGDRVSDIAREKGGIIRPGIPVVLGDLADEAKPVLLEQAATQQAPVSQLGRDFELEVVPIDAERSRLRFANRQIRLDANLRCAEHLAVNAALALECVFQIGDLPTDSDRRLGRALESTVLPGRVELIQLKPPVVVDAAHTQASALGLVAALKRLDASQLHLVLSVSQTKQIPAVCDPLMSLATQVTTTRAEPSRSLDADTLASELHIRWPEIPITAISDPDRALTAAYLDLKQTSSAVCVTGSVYLAGRARRILRQLLS